MNVSFFPGCSLEGTAREYGESIDAVCSCLGIQLEELPDWSCCGASSAHATSAFLSQALPARNLALAQKAGRDLITPCAACFSRLKAAEKKLTATEPGGNAPASGRPVRTRHILEFLCSSAFSSAIEQQVSRPLAGLKAVSYYGCLLVRPPKTVEAEHWENPQSLDLLLGRLGAESIDWPYKTECCGGGLVLTSTDLFYRLCGRLLDMACEAGAECIVTACPLCMANLDTREKETGDVTGTRYNLPVFYFTELMGLAFGHRSAASWLRRHCVDPRPLLKAKKLL